MDISKTIRDPQKVHDTLLEKDDQLITKSGCTIYVPEGYTSKGLAVIGTEISILGVFAIFIDDKTYGVSTATSMMTLGDNHITDSVMVGETVYLSYTFPAGAVVFKSVELIKEKKLVNAIMDFFFDYGYSPWWMTYLDMAELYKYAGYFNQMNMGGQIVQDIIVAGIARNPDNVHQFYRMELDNIKQIYQRPTFLKQRDIAMNTSSNLARINGSELARATKAVLLSEPTQPQELEDILMR